MLLSSSVSGLQKLLDVCTLTGKELCWQFNDQKSHCIAIGPKYECLLASLTLLGKPLQWVDSLKYLGITFKSSKTFTLDISQTRRKFFGCVNSIINHSYGTSELVKLHLMESCCYPVLMLSYAVECLNLPNSCIRQLNACWNSVYWRIFDFKTWESVWELISCRERMNLEYLYYQKSMFFE